MICDLLSSPQVPLGGKLDLIPHSCKPKSPMLVYTEGNIRLF
jgi:hypothetical protein